MNKLSWRHHYIPEFFIKGFFAPEKTFWVYDKETGRIKSRKFSPSQMFFEKDANSITIAGEKTDIIEKKLYKLVDDKISEQFKKIQGLPIEEIERVTAVSYILVMMATTIYRIPATKVLAYQLLKSDLKKMATAGVEETVLKMFSLPMSNEDKLKYVALIGPFLTILSDKKKGKGNLAYALRQCNETPFILSDNPVIYEFNPKSFKQLTGVAIFPVTSKRIYLGLKNREYTFGGRLAADVNLLLALQAKRYFASENKELLESVAKGYKTFSSIHNDFQSYKSTVFKEIFD